jgi:hypothetical protein
MKILHISFHKGCQNDIQFVCDKLKHELEFMTFEDGITKGNARYNIGHDRAKTCWNNFKEYFNKFDLIITSDTTPISRVFLQNNFDKKLVIWICNRFDYFDGASLDCDFPDAEYYELIKSIPSRPNVKMISNCEFENFYLQTKGIQFNNEVIKPIGGLSSVYSETILTDIQNKSKTFWIPQYHNETILMNLSSKLNELGILNFNGRHGGLDDLKMFKGIISIPYAWSTISLFESLQLGMIYFIPSLDFIFELSKTGHFWFQPPFRKDLLHLSEWYSVDNKDIFVYFNSWEDLKDKITNLNFKEKKQIIQEYAKKHLEMYLNKWNILLQ